MGRIERNRDRMQSAMTSLRQRLSDDPNADPLIHPESMEDREILGPGVYQRAFDGFNDL